MNYGPCIGKRLADFDTHFMNDDEIEEIMDELVELLMVLNDRINKIEKHINGNIDE